MSTAGRRPSVVVVGGGHGCSRSLAALLRLDVERTAIVTVADDGGSSGRLRRDHDVVALGDLRMALLALTGPSGRSGTEEPAAPGDPGGAHARTVATLARRRFRRGELAGHSLGNLLLLGLLEEHGGDLIAAVDAFARLVGAAGRVLPATTVPVTLAAETASGPVAGQAAVATATRIRSVRLQPEVAPAAAGVLEAIGGADLVLLGPGSLYTSVLPSLLVGRIADALRSTKARVVVVGNLREQPGETEGMDLADHVDALVQHLPGLRIDVLLAHERSGGVAEPMARHRPLPIDERRLARHVGAIVRTDLGDELAGHDPDRLAAAIVALLGPPSSGGTRIAGAA
jgi:uncharacterized cofD-like protein